MLCRGLAIVKVRIVEISDLINIYLIGLYNFASNKDQQKAK